MFFGVELPIKEADLDATLGELAGKPQGEIRLGASTVPKENRGVSREEMHAGHVPRELSDGPRDVPERNRGRARPVGHKGTLAGFLEPLWSRSARHAEFVGEQARAVGAGPGT